jgi:hypothetical protein
MNTSEVIAAVRACTESQLREITAATGVPMPTLAKIKYGVTGDPRGSTVDKLRAHFEAPRRIKKAKPVPVAQRAGA